MRNLWDYYKWMIFFSLLAGVLISIVCTHFGLGVFARLSACTAVGIGYGLYSGLKNNHKQ